MKTKKPIKKIAIYFAKIQTFRPVVHFGATTNHDEVQQFRWGGQTAVQRPITKTQLFSWE